ncbi:MAG: 5-formyltetrahydrofolate cyclo-ligase [SAR324 cluster bacterium]|nr:5-formyltetrahydrofolate cyclo-ligase [SAR324 cluster bacterium]MBL7034579.1 5-formyltetrahydrofolate cyclo-ligase [SAR324 cluster bacterium]
MSEALLLSKIEIRQSVIRQRKLLSAEKKRLAEIEMLKSLSKWDLFKNAAIVHIFLAKTAEPETRQIIELGWKYGKQIGVPCILPDKLELFHSQLNSFDNLSAGSLGVLEPSAETRIELSPKIFELIIVPGLAFDRNGGRIGYGKGYYDKFLANSSAFLLALAFDFQVLDRVPAEPHDISMNGILTETGLIFCGASNK